MEVWFRSFQLGLFGTCVFGAYAQGNACICKCNICKYKALCLETCILVSDRALRTMKIYNFYIEHDSCIIEKEKILYEINEEEKGQISLT